MLKLNFISSLFKNIIRTFHFALCELEFLVFLIFVEKNIYKKKK